MAAVAQNAKVPVAADSRIVDWVGDVSRPQRPPQVELRLDHLPGLKPGVVSAISWLYDYMGRGVVAVSDYVRKYGPVSRVPFRSGSAVMVGDGDMVMRIARNAEQEWSTALAWMSFFEGVDLRGSLGGLDFEPHRDARKLLQPAFAPTALDGYMQISAPLIEQAIDGWVERGAVAFKADVRALLASVSSRVFLGNEASGPMLDRALAQTWLTPFALFRNAFFSPTWRRGTRAHRTLSDSLRAMIPARRAAGGADLFSRLCAAPDGTNADDDTIVRTFIGVMLGAFDTTSAGIASMAYLLARHPDWQESMRREAVALGPGPLTMQKAQELDMADRCWKETLRLYPVTGAIPRLALRDVELGRQRIPAGALVFAMIGSTQRDGDWWTRPDTFDPDRFAVGRAEEKKRPGQFMPFGAGAHACIGSMLSTLEVKAFWHAMLPRCRFRLAADYDARHEYKPMGSVSGPVKLVVEEIAG